MNEPTTPADNQNAPMAVASGAVLGCWWKFDETTWSYDTTCDNKFQFDNGGVNENGFKFCPYCGKPILQPADVEVREARKDWNDDEAA